MPVKPSITVDVRASQAVYTTGPVGLIGKDTKIQRAAADVTEGHKVDSPLGTFPVDAQNENYGDNVVDQYALWTSLGTNAADGDAHIVETNETGDIAVLGIECRDLRVTPNAGTDGIEVTTSGGSKGVEVIQDVTSTDHGVHVTSADGAAAPAVFVDTVSTVGMLIEHGSLGGLVIDSTADGGIVGPSIQMDPNTIEPINNGVGTFWNREQNSIENVKVGMGGSAGYIVVAKNPLCYARSVRASHALTGSVVDQVLGPTFSFKTDQVPQDASEVTVTIWGQMTTRASQDNTIVLRVRDTNAGNAVICQLFIYTLEHTSPTTNTIRQSATISDIYQLPGSGTRTFDLVWTGDTTGVSATFEGYVEVQELRG
jgi:hypothetical protein